MERDERLGSRPCGDARPGREPGLERRHHAGKNQSRIIATTIGAETTSIARPNPAPEARINAGVARAARGVDVRC
ncbi:MAG: hypothetical protein JO090_13905 [Rhizobacter sp.]|nr:hypothetical protein [Rhizobacter sp.]